MNNPFNPLPLSKLTKLQLVAKAPALVELFVMPFLVIVAFIFARQLAELPYFSDILNKPPSLPFLRDQYDFLLARGIGSIAAELPLRIFEVLIWVLIPILLLRVVLSPYLFGLVNLREKIQATGGSILKFVAAWPIMAYAIWASTDIRASSSATGLTSLLKASPRAYICLEAFIFICSSILFVEESLALFEIALSGIRGSKSPRPFKDSER